MRRRLQAIILIWALLALWASAAWGAEVTVNPVRVHLSSAKRSEILALTNSGAATIRFQVVAYTWQQSKDGEMQLGPTTDLVFFPSLLEVKRGETRRIRVASKVSAGNLERTYRLFVEELPAAIKTPGQVRVLARLGIPVFVQPPAAKGRPVLSASARGDAVYVSLVNAGTGYFVAKSVRVVARSADGKVLFEQSLLGWYVLARGRRDYGVPVPKEQCAGVRRLTIVALTDAGDASTELNVNPFELSCR